MWFLWRFWVNVTKFISGNEYRPHWWFEGQLELTKIWSSSLHCCFITAFRVLSSAICASISCFPKTRTVSSNLCLKCPYSNMSALFHSLRQVKARADTFELCLLPAFFHVQVISWAGHCSKLFNNTIDSVKFSAMRTRSNSRSTALILALIAVKHFVKYVSMKLDKVCHLPASSSNSSGFIPRSHIIWFLPIFGNHFLSRMLPTLEVQAYFSRETLKYRFNLRKYHMDLKMSTGCLSMVKVLADGPEKKFMLE